MHRSRLLSDSGVQFLHVHDSIAHRSWLLSCARVQFLHGHYHLFFVYRSLHPSRPLSRTRRLFPSVETRRPRNLPPTVSPFFINRLNHLHHRRKEALKALFRSPCVSSKRHGLFLRSAASQECFSPHPTHLKIRYSSAFCNSSSSMYTVHNISP